MSSFGDVYYPAIAPANKCWLSFDSPDWPARR